MKQKIIVFYHDDHDGFGGAWVAWKKLKSNARYIALNHPATFEQLNPYVRSHPFVYFIDFCPEESVLKHVERIAKSVVIIDHHISRKDVVLARKESVFNDTHSGAFLAWKYFHPHVSMPLLVRYVQDFDMWAWKLRGTEALLVSLPWEFDFLHWNWLSRIVENKKSRNLYIRKGLTMLEYRKHVVESIAQEAEEVRLGKTKAFAVDAPKIFIATLGMY